MNTFKTVYVVTSNGSYMEYMDVFGSEESAQAYIDGLVGSGYQKEDIWLTETTVQLD